MSSQFYRPYPGVAWDYKLQLRHLMALMICYAYNLRERQLFIVRILIIALVCGCSSLPAPVKKQPVYTTRTTLADGKFFVMIDTFKNETEKKTP